MNPPSRSPTYDLGVVQELVRQRLYRITVPARKGASDLYLDESDIVDCVLLLREEDFYKTMEAEKAKGLYQDVYRLRYQSRAIYLKLQINRRQTAIVISFKHDEMA